jgi:cation-transporting ATPase E
MTTQVSAGLSAAEVAQRRAAGQVNVVQFRSARSVWSIVRANVLTRFNAIIGVLLVVVLIFGPIQDGLFGLVIVVNSAVGIVQELRAKRTLDSLTLLERAPVRVRRDHGESEIVQEDVVLDDIVVLGTGAKVPVDGVVVSSEGLELDESLLTGEADSVAKQPGDQVLSGSFVVAGAGTFAATKVGPDAYANRLVQDTRRFELAHSELMAGINRILRGITWVIVPIGVLLIVSQVLGSDSLAEAMVGSVAGIVPMVPEGLVLLTSVAFAVGVIRLGRQRCLVQELPAIEVLARVDTVCLDKTGTLTAPELDLVAIQCVDGSPETEVRAALAALAHHDPSPNPTMRAIAAGVTPVSWNTISSVPFSSARKYSAADFGADGSWVLGAADVILAPGDPQRDTAESLGATGMRVLALGRATAPIFADGGPSAGDRTIGRAGRPVGVRAAALIVLRQRLRPEAAETLRYLADEGLHLKILSGDNPRSVGAIAAAVGVPGAHDAIDARTLPLDPARLAEQLDQHTVFGRVTPEQKRAFVAGLRAGGHTVAMTGDGVNDALALKSADLGIAMGSGSPATRAVAKVILLDNSFAAVPRVLAEGRRVLGNIERVAGLFLAKTAYSLVLAILVGVAHVPFPFLPRHITLVGSLTIGIPGFFLALAPNNERARPGFVSRVLRFAVPAGLICGVTAFAAYGLARLHTGTDQAADRSAATLTLFLAASWVLLLVARPLSLWRAALVGATVAAFVLIAAVPWSANFFALSYPDPTNVGLAVGLAAAAAIALTAVHRPTAAAGCPA